MMNRNFVLLVLSLFSFATMVEAQTKLLYPQQQVLKRQTMNMNEIQKEIDKQQQQGANDAVNAAQQALMAQFNQMLKNDPNLKSQFDAATPEQQAASCSNSASSNLAEQMETSSRSCCSGLTAS